jgi:FkbM family methyltransferase
MQGQPLPKDNPPLPNPPRRPGLVPRILSWLFATGGGEARGGGFSTQEELFRIRGELAVLRAGLEAVRAGVGRRDIATLEELLRAGNRREIEALIRDRTQTVPLPDGSVLCRALGRFKMFVDAADPGIAPHLLLDGYWQYWVTEFICRNLSRGEVAWDIGAIYGYYTILMADLVGAEGRVLAYEPNPWLHWLLGRNLFLNGLGAIATAKRLAAVETAEEAVTLPAMLTGPADGPFAAEFTEANGRRVHTAPGVALEEAETAGVDFIRIGSAAIADRTVAGMGGVLDRNPNLRILLDFDAARCREAAAMLAALAARFPLRVVDGDSFARPTTVEELLERRRVATLYLSRLEPR